MSKQETSRIWVRKLNNLGFEVMCSPDVMEKRHVGFRQNPGDANDLAQDVHNHAAAFCRLNGRDVPSLELWEAPK